MVAENAIFADDRMCMREKVVAYMDAAIKHDVGQERCVGSDVDIGADDDVCADVGLRSDHGRGVDDSGGVNAGSVRRRLVEEAERAGKSVIRILDANRGCCDLLKLRLNNDRCGLGGAGEGSVAGIRDEGDLRGPGFFNALHACDFQVRIAAQFGAQTAC